MTGGPLLRSGLFLGTLLLGGTLSAKIVPMPIDDFSFVASGRKRAASSELRSCSRRVRLTCAALELGFCGELQSRALLPPGNHFQIESPHEPFIQARSLSGCELGDSQLRASARSLRALRVTLRPRSARATLTEQLCLTIDPLTTKPMQGLERIPVTHGPESSKAPSSAVERRICAVFFEISVSQPPSTTSTAVSARSFAMKLSRALVRRSWYRRWRIRPCTALMGLTTAARRIVKRRIS